MWIIYIPAGIVVVMLIVAALPFSRKVTPEGFADELEHHLLGTEGPWGWDDATSVRIADRRLEQLRLSLTLTARFDNLSQQQDRNELEAVIAALRRGEIPEIKARADD
jgi:hypothetical protein